VNTAATGTGRVQPADVEALRQQLGRPPQGVIAVAARQADGQPAVIVNHPLRRDRAGRVVPFPTVFWLSDPELSRAVSDLERRGMIAAMEAALVVEPETRMRLRVAQRRCVTLRWGLLNPAERRLADQVRLTSVLRSRGIGGVAAWQAVKCLHAHVADHLACSRRTTDQRRAPLRAASNPVVDLLLRRYPESDLSQRLSTRRPTAWYSELHHDRPTIRPS